MVNKPISTREEGRLKLVEWENKSKNGKKETFTSYSLVKEVRQRDENDPRKAMVTTFALNGLFESDLKDLKRMINKFCAEKDDEEIAGL